MTIIYDEGRQVTLSADSKSSVKRTLRVVPYASYIDVAKALLPYTAVSGGVFVRKPPARDPLYPYCFASAVEVEGVGVYQDGEPSGTAILDYANGYSEGARLVVTYETSEVEWPDEDDEEQPSDEDDEIDLAKESWEFSAKQITLPVQACHWESFRPDSPPEPVSTIGLAPAKTIPVIQFSLTVQQVPRWPTKSARLLVGRINREPFLTRLYQFPAETMLFEGLDATRSITSEGEKRYDLTYKFSVMPVWDLIATGDEISEVGYVGWNRLLRHETGSWRRVLVLRTGYVYDLAWVNGRRPDGIYLYAEDAVPLGMKQLFSFASP
jgi:hypothetical protein